MVLSDLAGVFFSSDAGRFQLLRKMRISGYDVSRVLEFRVNMSLMVK